MTSANINKLRADAAWHREQADRIELFIADSSIGLPDDDDEPVVKAKVIAGRLNVSESTARRWSNDLGMKVGGKCFLPASFSRPGKRTLSRRL